MSDDPKSDDQNTEDPSNGEEQAPQEEEEGTSSDPEQEAEDSAGEEPTPEESGGESESDDEGGAQEEDATDDERPAKVDASSEDGAEDDSGAAAEEAPAPKDAADHEEPQVVAAPPTPTIDPKSASRLPISVPQVSDLLLELSEIAQATGLQSLYREVVEDRIPMLESGQITLVVLGEFNHGKSTVVNALLGEDVLPVGITPTTAVITHLVHGEERNVRVKPPLGGKPFEIEYDEMEDAVKNAEEDGNEPEWVEIAHPNTFLENSLTLVDTPGVNDISRQKVEITYGYLPRADVIIYVLDATQVLKKSEVTFIRDRLLKANRDRIVFVLNKVDALSDDDAKEVELYARERLEQLIGPVELFAFSGRQALEAEKAGKKPPAGYLEFREFVVQFLDESRGYIILDSALSGGLRVAGMLEQNLAIKKQGYMLEAKDLDNRIKAVNAKLRESRRLIADNVDLIEERTKGIAATAKSNLRTFREGFVEALPLEIERADARDVKRYLPLFIQDTFKAFIEKEGADIARNLEELAEDVIEITNQSLLDTIEALREELGMSKDLDLEVDTIAYDIGVAALGALGVTFLFVNVLVGGLLTIAAPVLAFFLRDKVDAKVKERAREEGVRAIEEASVKVEEEMLRVINEYGDRLKEFVETAGERLYSQIEEVLEQIQKERSENQDQAALLAEVEVRLDAVRRVGKVLKKSRERLAESVG